MTHNHTAPPLPAGPYVATNRRLRTTLLCLLYFAQGFPWGFASVALLSALSEAGHSKAQTAMVTALAVLPWTFKFLWAPMIDSLRMPALGLRRPWIALAQTGMAATLFGVWSTGALENESALTTIAWVFFAHNCFASLQDVATDSMAIDLLEEDERGRVNGFMWASKLLGIAFGGAGLGLVIAHSSIRVAALIQAVLILAILAVVLAVRERRGERLFPWTSGAPQAPETMQVKGGLLGVARELLRAMSLRSTLLGGVVALTAMTCNGLYLPLTTELFVQDFGWGAARYAEAAGSLGVLGELCGAFLGGFLADRLGGRRMAGYGMIAMSGVLLTFAFTSSYWFADAYPRIALLPLFKGTLAFTSVSLFSMFMKLSWTGAAACQFTLYMALSNVAIMAGTALNGLNDWVGAAIVLEHQHFYMLAGLLALVPLPVLAFLDPEEVHRPRHQLDRVSPSTLGRTEAAPRGSTHA